LLTAALDVSGEIFRGWCPAVFPPLHAGRDTTEADTHRRFLRGCIFGPGCKSRRLQPSLACIRERATVGKPTFADVSREGPPQPASSRLRQAKVVRRSFSEGGRPSLALARRSLGEGGRPQALLMQQLSPFQLHPSTADSVPGQPLLASLARLRCNCVRTQPSLSRVSNRIQDRHVI
jgi:hypothetical protein